MRRKSYVCRPTGDITKYRVHGRTRYLSTLAFAGFITAASAANITFSVTDLGTFPGALFGYATDMNSQGAVVGTAFLQDSGAYHAYSQSGGVWTDLGTLGGKNSYATATNGAGTIVGSSDTDSGSLHAFNYQGGVMIDMGTLAGGNQSIASAINSCGMIVGSSEIAGGATHAFSYSGGMMTDLGTVGGSYSEAYAINDVGIVTGYSSIAGDARNHAVLFSNGVTIDLSGSPDALDSYGFGINAAGDVVGEMNESNGDYHGFLYSGGTWTDLGTLGGSYSDAYSINSSGTVFGRAQIAGNAEFHAFMYSQGAMTDLNTLLDSTGIGWDLQSAELTSSGQIIGYGYFNGNADSFLLVPSDVSAGNFSSSVPEPGSALMLVGGLGLIGTGRRRR